MHVVHCNPKKQNMHSCILTVISPIGENTLTLRLTSELVDLRVGYAKRIRRTRFADPPLRGSVNMMHVVHHIYGGLSKRS